MATWDNNAPGTIGLGWWPNQIGGTPATQGRAVAMSVDSTAAETIANAWVGFDSATMTGRWCLDVFAAGSEVPGAVSQASFVPTADEVNTANLWQNQAGSAVNLFNSIDNGVVNPASYITYAGTFTQKGTYAFNIGSGGWAANRRVLSMTFTFSASADANAVGRMQVIYRGSATNYVLGQVSVTNSVETFSFTLGELNPDTGLPWTQAAVQALASSAGFGWRALSGATVAMRVFDASVSVNYCTENRVASGNLLMSAFSDGPVWQTFPLIQPNSGAANWSKANGTTYTFVVRPLSTQGAPPGVFTAGQGSPRTLDSGLPLPTGSVGYRPLVDSVGAVVTMGDDQTFGMSLALDVNASATDSVDGQPYIRVGAFGGSASGQDINGAAAGSYTLMRAALVALDSNDLDLPVTWDIIGPGPTTLDSGTITWDEVLAGTPLAPAGPDTPPGDQRLGLGYLVEVPISVTLAAATTYQVDWGGSSASVREWVLVTEDVAGTTRGNPATYGGTTLDWDAFAYADMAVTLSTVPDPVTGLSVSYELFDTSNVGCNPTQIPYVVLEWNPTTLGADFGWYELQYTTDGIDYTTIGHITDEHATLFQWPEFPYDTGMAFRIRVVRAGDLIPSLYTNTGALTIEGECVYYLTSTFSDLQLAYNPGDRTTWQFPSSDETQIEPRAGADYQQALVSSEWRGDRFEVDLSVWTPNQTNKNTDPPGGPKRWSFDPILELTRDAVPYVCVRDETGRVWYANVNVQEATADSSGAVPRLTATAVITEVVGEPAVADVVGPYVFDNFDRPDNPTDLGDTLTGQTWAQFSSGPGVNGIIDDAAYASTSDPVFLAAIAGTGFVFTDGYVQADISNTSGQIQRSGVLTRVSPTVDAGLSLSQTGVATPDEWELLYEDGGLTVIATINYTTTTFGAVRVRLETLGTQCTVYLDGKKFGPYTIPAADPANGCVGFLARDTDVRINNFRAGPLPYFDAFPYVP